MSRDRECNLQLPSARPVTKYATTCACTPEPRSGGGADGSVKTRSDHKLCRMKLIQCPDGISYPVNKSAQKRGPGGRPPRLLLHASSGEFAEAVDHALRDIDDLEEAQRRIRTLAEECFRTDPTQKTRPQWQKDNNEHLKQLLKERRQAFADLQNERTVRSARRTGQLFDAWLQNGGIIVYTTYGLQPSTGTRALCTKV